jgi:hypothetical protein
MIFKKINYISFLFLVASSITGQSALANQIYRWTDENGRIYLSDRVTFDRKDFRRETLNKNAHTIEVTEKAKTKFQHRLEKQLALLRKQQEKIIAKQAMSDKVLLSTYRNRKDMESALERKMASLDGKRRVVQGSLKRLEKQLRQQQQKAAQYDRDGKKVPVKIVSNLSDTRIQIKLTSAEIVNQLENKLKVKKTFNADIIRFAVLKSKKGSNKYGQQTMDINQLSKLGIYTCLTDKICKKAWRHAKLFVNTFSSTELDIATDSLIMSYKPNEEGDYSLSVSKTSKQQLFLDIHCYSSELGKELCQGKKVQEIRQSFSAYIKTALAFKAK